MLITKIQETNEYKFIEINGEPIEFLTPRHFNKNEARALKIDGRTTLGRKELDYFSSPENLSKYEANYAYKLALYGRIQLNSNIQTTCLSIAKYNIMDFENFRFIENIFEENFNRYSLINNLQISPETFKQKLYNELLKLWLRGYSLLPGHNKYVISNEILNELFSSRKEKRHLSRFLSFVLKDIDASPVTTELPNPKLINKQHLLSSEESELNKWHELLKGRDTSLNKDLFGYLEFLLERANNTVTRYIPTKDGKQIKKSYSQIKWGNFNLKSGNLRKAIPLLYNLGIFNIEQILNENALLNLYASEQFKLLSIDEQQNIRNILREFVKYYCETKGFFVNIERIAPSVTKNNITTYSENINFGDANILLDALLDDSNCLIDEKDLHQAKCRRALLLQVTTGVRIHEVLLLNTDCLVTNNVGDTFIHFHKTKTNKREHYVKADSDMIEWIKELQSISVPIPILVSSKNTVTTFGDDLTALRLFPNSNNNNIILPGSVNRFLDRLGKDLKLKSHFSTHDMRKIHALYLKMKGKDKVDIQFALNQDDIDSQLPYLATKSNKVVENLKSVSIEGVWSHITETMQSDSDVPLETVLSRSSSFQTSAESKERTTNFLENIVTEITNQNKQLPVHSEDSPTTGMPMYSHNCTASIVVNCGHTELDCFSCNKYAPDQDKLNEHKAEILRYMIQVLFYEAEAKKNKLEQDYILINSKEIKQKLQKTFNSLFAKFRLNKTEAVKIEKTLNSIAKKYWKANKVLLSHPEALRLLSVKEM